MLRVKTDFITSNGNTMPIMDIVQWVHKHNKSQKAWGISFRPDERNWVNCYLETDCAQIMNAVQKEWPNAEIVNSARIS
jgi:hypothetical protein